MRIEVVRGLRSDLTHGPVQHRLGDDTSEQARLDLGPETGQTPPPPQKKGVGCKLDQKTYFHENDLHKQA